LPSDKLSKHKRHNKRRKKEIQMPSFPKKARCMADGGRVKVGPKVDSRSANEAAANEADASERKMGRLWIGSDEAAASHEKRANMLQEDAEMYRERAKRATKK
jgi:hypothetical protein